jgi:hypothetical protein
MNPAERAQLQQQQQAEQARREQSPNKWEQMAGLDAFMLHPEMIKQRIDGSIVMGQRTDGSIAKENSMDGKQILKAANQYQNKLNVPAVNQPPPPTPTPPEPRPASYQMQPVDPVASRQIQAPQVNNSIPDNWWDYMKQTSGGKGGAISRMATGVLQNIGAGLQRGAAAGSGGKFGDANAQDNPDALGLEGYAQLQQGAIRDQQEINKQATQMNMQDDFAWNNHQRDLEKLGINHEMAKELQAIANQYGFDVAKMQQEMTLKLLEKNWTLQMASNAVGQLAGLFLPKFSSGCFTGHGNKYEPAGIVHKGEYVIPKVGVNQTTEKPKPSFYKFLNDPNVPNEHKTENPDKYYSDWLKSKQTTI